MFDGFDREDLVAGLKDVVARARAAEIGPIVLRVVGGAALRLIYFERDITGDIDASFSPDGPLRSIIEDVAHDRLWPDTWLNDNVARAGYLPDHGATIEWVTVFQDDLATVQIAPADVLLAMKLRALDQRGDRDLGDALELMALCRVTTITEVLAALHRYFPSADLTPRTIDLLVFHLGRKLPDAPPALPRLVW